jgi:hypothetical protein
MSTLDLEQGNSRECRLRRLAGQARGERKDAASVIRRLQGFATVSIGESDWSFIVRLRTFERPFHRLTEVLDASWMGVN